MNAPVANSAAISRVARFAPGLAALLAYRRTDLRYDLAAGLSVAAVALPVGVAYAELTGLPPVTGLYASILPAVAYAIFGTSRQLIVGPDAATCAMTAAAVAPLAAGNPELYLSFTVALTLLAGLMCIAASFLRAGALADFLSKPILTGYLAGVALSILLGQTGKLTGFELHSRGIVPHLLELVDKLGLTHWPTLAVGAGTFAVLIVMGRLAPRWPAALVAIVLSAAAVAVLGLDRHGVKVVGELAAGLPILRLPEVPLDDLDELLGRAAGIALISFTSGILTARAFASKNRYELDVDREFAAFGASHIAAAISQSFPVTGADSRTAASDAAGGRTQVTGLVAAAAILLVLLFLTGPLRYVPAAALGAILIKSAIGLIDTAAFREILRIDRREFLLAILTMLGVVWVGAIHAVLIAVGLALLRFVQVAARPPFAVLGRVPGARGLDELAPGSAVVAIPGLVLYRFKGPVAFFNAPYFRSSALATVRAAGPGIRTLVIDNASLAVMDATALFMLLELRTDLAALSVQLALAGRQHPVAEWLRAHGYTAVADGSDGRPAVRLYATLEDAVADLAGGGKNGT